MLKDLGVEQGFVDGPLECSLALGMVAGSASVRHALQKSGGLADQRYMDDGASQPWCCLFCRISVSPTLESERSGTH